MESRVPDEMFFQLWEFMNLNPDFESVDALVRRYPPQYGGNQSSLFGHVTELYFSYQIARAVEQGLPLTGVSATRKRIRGGYLFEQRPHGSIRIRRKFKGCMNELTDIDFLCKYDDSIPIIFEYTNGERKLRRRLKRMFVRMLYSSIAPQYSGGIEFCEIRLVRDELRISKLEKNWKLTVAGKNELEEIASRLYARF